MITFLDLESDKVVAIKISGKIGEEEFEAVVTKQEWMRKISELADELMNGIEVRAFRSDEKEKAKEWISE